MNRAIIIIFIIIIKNLSYAKETIYVYRSRHFKREKNKFMTDMRVRRAKCTCNFFSYK